MTNIDKILEDWFPGEDDIHAADGDSRGFKQRIRDAVEALIAQEREEIKGELDMVVDSIQIDEKYEELKSIIFAIKNLISNRK